MQNLLQLFSIFLAFGMVSPLHAGDFHSLAEIQKAATQFVSQQTSHVSENTTIEAGRLDPRLKLKKCTTPISTKSLTRQNHSANTTVVVMCNDKTKPWTVYVPVTTKTYVTVAVAKRPLARGIAVQEDDIYLEQREITRLTHGYFKASNLLIDRTPRRSIPKGAVISPKDLAIKKVVSKGSRVSIIAETNGITVRMPGKALSDAGEGDQIQVKNLSSGRSITGVVVAHGVVKVAM